MFSWHKNKNVKEGFLQQFKKNQLIPDNNLKVLKLLYSDTQKFLTCPKRMNSLLSSKPELHTKENFESSFSCEPDTFY